MEFYISSFGYHRNIYMMLVIHKVLQDLEKIVDRNKSYQSANFSPLSLALHLEMISFKKKLECITVVLSNFA